MRASVKPLRTASGAHDVKPKHPPGPPMTLGNMREVAQKNSPRSSKEGRGRGLKFRFALSTLKR
jgi:hypothetical protein